MISVASTRPETVFNSVSNVTVIDRRMIESYNYESVSDALQTVAGVLVWRTYAMKHVVTFRGGLQEHYANKILVMINNVPAWNAVTGEADIDRVGIDSVERIEVLRGPASVLYGSNALTGAINIVLRQAPMSSRLAEAKVGVGSGHDGFSSALDVTRAAGVYSRAKRDSAFHLSSDYLSQRQPQLTFTDDTKTTFELNEYFIVRNLNAYYKSGGHGVLVNLSNSVQNYGGNSITLASGARHPHEKEMQLVNYAYSFGPRWGNLKYSVSYDRQRRQIPRDAADSLRSDILGARYVNTLSAEADLPGSFSLEFGGSHDYREAERYNNFIATSQAVVAHNKMSQRGVWEGSAFAQLVYEQEPWKFAAGTRYTHNAAFGDDFSSRASAVYMINERNSLKLMAGQSFRAPTPFELYFQNAPTTVLGNPALRPEKTATAEISYLTSWERLLGQVTVYYTDYINTICRSRGDFIRDGQVFSNTSFYDNAARYNSKGAEIELRYTTRHSSIFSAFNYIQGSRGDSYDVPAPGVFGLSGGQSANFKYVPRYTLSAGAAHSVANPFGHGEFFGSFVAYHYSSMDTLRTRLPGQAWADLSAGFKRDAFKHTLAIHNATGSTVAVPEYVRQRVVESMPLVNGRRINYTVSYKF